MERLPRCDALLFEPRIERVEVRRATVVHAAGFVTRCAGGFDDERAACRYFPASQKRQRLRVQVHFSRAVFGFRLEVFRALDANDAFFKVHLPPSEKVNLPLPQSAQKPKREDFERLAREFAPCGLNPRTLILPNRGICECLESRQRAGER